MKGGGAGAHVAGIVYEPELTYDLPPGESGGTALNALAHCAEALYVQGKNDQADAEALAGCAAHLRQPPARPRRRPLSRRKAGAPRGRHARRRRARGRGPGARACDGPGGRRPLRHRARCRERDLPAAGASLQPGGRRGRDRALRGGDAHARPDRARRGACRGSPDSRSCATSAFRGTTCPRWPKRPPSGAARRRTRALPQPTTFSGSSRASGEGTATSLSPSTARSSG